MSPLSTPLAAGAGGYERPARSVLSDILLLAAAASPIISAFSLVSEIRTPLSSSSTSAYQISSIQPFRCSRFNSRNASPAESCDLANRLREQNDDLATCHKPPLTLLRSRAAGQAQTQLLLCV